MFRSLFDYTIVSVFFASFQCFGIDLRDLSMNESTSLGSAKLHMDRMVQDAAVFRRQKSTAPTRLFVPMHESPIPADESAETAAKLHMDRMAQGAAVFRRQKSTAPTRFVPMHESPIPADELAETAAKLHMDRMMQDAAIFRR